MRIGLVLILIFSFAVNAADKGWVKTDEQVKTEAAAKTEPESKKPDPARPRPPLHENMFKVLGIMAGCTIIGMPTCIALSPQREAPLKRSWSDQGGQMTYLASWMNGKPDESFQRAEGHVYKGNALVAGAHRRSFEDGFISTSVRAAYQFVGAEQWSNMAMGAGFRTNHEAHYGDAMELWFPVHFRRKEAGKTSGMFETLWVFRKKRIRLEGQARLGYNFTKNLTLSGGVGYFSDADEPELEISAGPTYTF